MPEGLSEKFPEPIRKVVRRVKAQYRLTTATGRALPSVVLAGVQKGGTTSLFHQLRVHPRIVWPRQKGTHYFDLNYQTGLRWYQSNFPHTLRLAFRGMRVGGKAITAESCGYYFDHPAAARRCAETLPDAKIVIMLRNPVERAYSSYHDAVGKGYEPLSFEEAIEAEEQRLAGEVEKFDTDPTYYSMEHRHLSYLARSIYVDHVRRWMDAFPREQVLVLKSEAFYSDMAAEFGRVLRFLGLPPWEPAVFEKQNVGRYSKLSVETRERLAAYFAPHNQRLYELLGADLGWE